MATELELAWLAGLVDGEGCISIIEISPRGKSVSPIHRLVFIIQMTDRAAIEKAHVIIGMGSVTTSAPHSSPGHNGFKETYRLSTSARESAQAIRMIQPYLVTKATEADIAFEFAGLPNTKKCKCGVPQELIDKRRALMLRIKANKPKTGRKKKQDSLAILTS